MANYLRCDRCGKSTEQNKYLNITKISLRYCDTYTYRNEGDDPITKELDMCKTCVKITVASFELKVMVHESKMP